MSKQLENCGVASLDTKEIRDVNGGGIGVAYYDGYRDGKEACQNEN